MRNQKAVIGSCSKRLICSAAILAVLSTALSAQKTDTPASEAFRTVAPGIEHLRTSRGAKTEADATGPWLINILRADLKQIELSLVHALDEGVGLETTSSMAARYGATAAINAGFFRTTGTYRGEPSGVLSLNGKLISEPASGRAAFGLVGRRGETQIIFGHLKFSGDVESANRKRLAINGVNRPRGAGELILYTPEFHRTTLSTPDGVEVVVRRNRVVLVRDLEGSSRIPADGFVISATGKARVWVLANIRAHTSVRVDTRLIPARSKDSGLWEQAKYIVGGGPQIIKDGRVAITHQAEGIAARFADDRHPRTAIARLKDGRLLLATVDGRQPGLSIGMSLSELASLLLEFEATEAINLDGGGSTTMVVSGKIVNSPSDQAGERPISDAILLIPRRLQRTHQMH